MATPSLNPRALTSLPQVAQMDFQLEADMIQKLQDGVYQAFGKQKVVSAGSNKYVYNGKELQKKLGQPRWYGN